MVSLLVNGFSDCDKHSIPVFRMDFISKGFERVGKSSGLISVDLLKPGRAYDFSRGNAVFPCTHAAAIERQLQSQLGSLCCLPRRALSLTCETLALKQLRVHAFSPASYRNIAKDQYSTDRLSVSVADRRSAV